MDNKNFTFSQHISSLHTTVKFRNCLYFTKLDLNFKNSLNKIFCIFYM